MEHQGGQRSVRLTPREEDVLRLIALGLPNKQIAVRLGLAERTVATHMERLFVRLGAHSRAEAVAIWLQSADRPNGRPSRDKGVHRPT